MRLAFLLLLVAACGDDNTATNPGLDAAGSVDAAIDGPTDDAAPSCQRLPGPADRLRRIVVSHPDQAAGVMAKKYEVMSLSMTGEITQGGAQFEMGTASQGEIVFTPDGEIGLAPQDDGTIGVFRLDDNGQPAVVDPGFHGGFYAMRIVMDPAGDSAWVLDTEWRNVGGGIYRIHIGCDGALSSDGLWAPSKLPAGLVPLGDGRAAVIATDLMTSAAGDNAFLLGPGPSLLAGAPAFPDDQAIISSTAVTSDGRWLLAADNSEFSGLANRIAVVEITATGLRAAQMLSPLNDPVALIPSPFDDLVLVASGYGNALLTIAPDSTGAFQIGPELTYQGAPPQLPGTVVMIARGSLRGRVLVSESGGIRQVQLAAGTATDLGLTATGTDIPSLVGAMGVQP